MGDSNSQIREDWGIVLDYLPNGKVDTNSMRYQNRSIAQVMGLDHFTLLEVIPRNGVSVEIGEKLYIGSGKRDKVNHIYGRINFNDLSATAQRELPRAVKQIVTENESVFINFFNNAQPINTRMHQLMLLPGLGKKHLWEVLNEREYEPFNSFDDLKQRVSLIPDPLKMIVKRIVDELKKEQKHYLFVNRD